MPTEQVTVEMDKTALYLARGAAEAAHLSLGDWLSKVAREQGMVIAAEQAAENDRRFPDEPPGWADDVEDCMFREGD
ncbi:hypothetical protein [Paractinoplanes rishiriensis]|uniref:Antitoxin n=1 Tax=Paractinoplanes rishiriensis TaxID=1050105 RepID=A0A919K1W9_9ACTN|nr:hypothetical protein [Actinoplanes rishiriensis]GIE97919.1 hypothetical protein Ari01nite_53840 [Actinoplanes rishiriensis]